MDQQTPTRYSDVAEWKLESSWWQGVSSDIKGCLSGRERKFLNGDLLLLFLITVFVIRLDNTITITGGQNSCGWSPVYWFFCYEWSVIYRLNNCTMVTTFLRCHQLIVTFILIIYEAITWATSPTYVSIKLLHRGLY